MSPWIWLVRGTDSPDVHMVDWTQLFRAVSATCFFLMVSHYFYGSERRLCRDGDVFQCWICLFSKKSLPSILWLLCIEKAGLKLPNYKWHKLAWNSLLCVMKSFCWVGFMKTLVLYGSQWWSCAGSTMFRFMHFPKRVLVVSFFHFFHRQIGA